MVEYATFLLNLDDKLKKIAFMHKDYLCCKKKCSICCKKGDYPISQIEFLYLMRGYINTSLENKKKIQQSIKNIKKGGMCPFLIDNLCSIYDYRPIICRVHGLAYVCKDNIVKLPYCTNLGKNYSKVYENNQLFIEPIAENLDTPNLLKDFNYGEIRNLYDWFKNT